jgi:tetratricopeptide (TPR) repeat protein/tRNA A-37 threonylcarbamoyl transferase component Bud32
MYSEHDREDGRPIDPAASPERDLRGPGDWPRIEAALDEILGLPESEWAAACARVAGVDARLHAEIASLLACAGGEDRLLDRSLTLPLGAIDTEPPGLRPGSIIGPYRVERLIGRGGMGEVYCAQRADGQFEQRVALKLIRHEAVEHAQRFQTERQILARLEHPGIARLHDGGIAPDGRPYMAMEFITGRPITEWCRTRALDLEARLALFVEVCAAVAYAHRNLVIHRDIKPGNVLVTEDGAVKLLDFGVAKLLETGARGDGEDLTRNAPLSPSHAAPEQLTGGAVTTATDVYALGVLLFDLLAGERPWRLDGKPMALVMQAILHDESPRLSDFVARKADAPFPPKRLRGDLDAIVAKCLRKEPAQRYENVNDLRLDVLHSLRGEPVAALQGARGYVFGRFLRRHRVLVAAASLLFVAIVCGALATAWQAHIARVQLVRADAEARRATAVKDFLLDIFKQNSVRNPGGAEARKATAEQLLAIGAERIKVKLRDEPAVRDELLDTLGSLYDEMGFPDRNADLQREHLEALRQRGPAALASAEAARVHLRLGVALTGLGKLEDGTAEIHAALRIEDALGDENSLDRAQTLYELARAAYFTKSPDGADARRNLLAALEIIRGRHPDDPLRADITDELGRHAQLADDFPAAERWYGESLSYQLGRGVDSNAFAIGFAYRDLGDLQAVMHRFTEGETNLRQAVELLTRAAGPDHPETADAKSRLGEMFTVMGRRREGAALLEEALASQLKTPLGRDDSTETVKSLGRLEYARGDLKRAESLMRGNLATFAHQQSNELRYATSAVVLVAALTAQGRFAEAAELYAKCEDMIGRYLGVKSESYGRVLDRGADLALTRGAAAEAEAIEERILREWPEKPGAFLDAHTWATLGLARARLAQDRFGAVRDGMQVLLGRLLASPDVATLGEQEAEARYLLGVAESHLTQIRDAEVQLRRAVELRTALDVPDSPWLAQVRIGLADCLIRKRRAGEARRLLDLAALAQSRQAALAEPYRFQLRAARAHLARDATTPVAQHFWPAYVPFSPRFPFSQVGSPRRRAGVRFYTSRRAAT